MTMHDKMPDTAPVQDLDANAAMAQGDGFHVLANTMPQMVWSTRPDGFHDYYNARWYEFTGMPEGSTDGEVWNDMFHPDDQDRAWGEWRHSLATGAPYDIEYRLRNAAGEYRWVLGRALPMRDAQGRITRWFGTCTDIHDQKLAMEQREIISHELSHRIKNIFSVIGGLVSISTREHPAFRGVAQELRARITALGRAHDFVRPHSAASASSSHNPSSLHGMLAQLLAPYQVGQRDRLTVTGDDPGIDDQSATPLALVFHELATNAAKHGALSVYEGRVAVSVDATVSRPGLGGMDEPSAQIVWLERGGPWAKTPGPEGFGTRLMELSVVRQLGGTIERDWQPEGLRAVLTIPLAAMRRISAGRRKG